MARSADRQFRMLDCCRVASVRRRIGSSRQSQSPRMIHSQTRRASAKSVIGPSHRAGAVGARSIEQSCSKSIAPSWGGRVAQANGPSKHSVMTNMPCGQRRTTFRSICRSWGATSAPQAVQMARVNGCLVGHRADVICATCDIDAWRAVRPGVVAADDSAWSPVLKMVLIKTPRHYRARCTLSKMNLITTCCRRRLCVGFPAGRLDS
jgi:hypothetical protein